MLAIWAAVLVLARKLGPEYEPEPELEVKIARRSTSVVLVPAAVQLHWHSDFDQLAVPCSEPFEPFEQAS